MGGYTSSKVSARTLICYTYLKQRNRDHRLTDPSPEVVS
jgi:hypothetical protein